MSHQSSTNVSERPIIFSGPMVCAIVEERKTQTRRVLKGSTEFKGPYNPAYLEAHRGSPGWARICPYGKPGDRLWVRESLQYGARNNPEPRHNHVWRYRADNALVMVDKSHESDMRVRAHHKEQDHCPSIHMPRWASRILLEIAQVRVERVQEISHRDALAEGVDYDVSKPDGSPLAHFQKLWDSINSKRGFGWEVNPWVWAISFKRVQP